MRSHTRAHRPAPQADQLPTDPVVDVPRADQPDVSHDFLAALAHELRNPLAPMRNAVAILALKAPAVPEVQWARGVIERQMQLLTAIVDDLLDVSRISGGGVALTREGVDLARVLQTAAEAAASLTAQDVDVSVEAPAPLILEGDEARLVQVFTHLVDHALRAGPAGGRVRLRAGAEGVDIVVSVESDPAPPDTDLQRPRLGPTLVHRLVDLHGGSLRLEPAGPGVGARALVRLPAHPPSPAEPARSARPRDEVQALARRVLIVDDNGDASDSLGMLLQILGVEFRTAYDGRTALAAAEEFRPDVVLLDIGLPDLDGYEVAKRIRAAPWGAGITLIAVTGWGQDEDRARSVAAGFDHHLVKPLAPETLMKLLATLRKPAR